MLKPANYKVLLIEDDKIDQMAFTRLIHEESLAYNCVMTDAVSQAKEILSEQDFDVIIADYLLKDGTGFDILEIVRDTPVIFATGAGNEKLAVKAIKAGAYDYLIKNPSRSYLSILPLIIENAINHAKMEKEVRIYHENLEDIVKERTEQLAAEKELLSITFSSMTDGIIVVDADKNVVLLNNVAEMLTGTNLEKSKGKNIDDILVLVDERSKEPIENLVDKVFETGEIQTKIETDIVVLGNKYENPVSIAAAPIRRNKKQISEVVILIHDRSQEREIDRMKTDFISSVSHELRTPLTSIKAYTETILRDPDMPESQKRDFLITIDKESDRLGELVNSLLEISQLESSMHEITKQYIDITDIIELIIHSLKCTAESKNIIIEKNIDTYVPEFWGNESKIRSLISNLVNNALKFTPDGGKIRIHLKYNNKIKIYVSDTGMGIPCDEITHIFDRFYRVRKSGSQIPGTGLGLAIVKEVAQIHGGTVNVKSKLGRGTTFQVILPLAEKHDYELAGKYSSIHG